MLKKDITQDINNNEDNVTQDDNEKKEKLEELKKEEQIIISQASGNFGLDILQIEKLMGHYKERNSNYLDLETIKEFGGPEIMTKFKTDPKKGISSIDNREHDFGSNKVFVEPIPPFLCICV